MDRKKCFGSIREIVVEGNLTMTEAIYGCRECSEFLDCLQLAKKKDEIRKQNMIAKIIDLSEVHTNEIGGCLLECLSRIYGSTLGGAMFRSLLLFYEVPKDRLTFSLNVPISSSVLDMVLGEEDETQTTEEFNIRIVLIQRHFPDQRRATMGLLIHEVAQAFSSDGQGIEQITQVLSGTEANLFRRMDPKSRVRWLVERWGFNEEFAAFQKALSVLEEK